MPQEAVKKKTVLLKGRQRKHFIFPQGYGDNKIVLLARDPWWVFAYWEIRPEKEEEVAGKIVSLGDSPQKSILRVYDVTNIGFTGKNAHSFFDIDPKGGATSWYINVGSPDRTWVADIGIVTDNGSFYTLARSNAIKTPRFGMSDVLDVKWMAPEEEYWKMFSYSGGFGAGKGSLEARKIIRERFEEQIVSGGISSGGSLYRKAFERKFLTHV